MEPKFPDEMFGSKRQINHTESTKPLEKPYIANLKKIYSYQHKNSVTEVVKPMQEMPGILVTSDELVVEPVFTEKPSTIHRASSPNIITNSRTSQKSTIISPNQRSSAMVSPSQRNSNIVTNNVYSSINSQTSVTARSSGIVLQQAKNYMR